MNVKKLTHKQLIEVLTAHEDALAALAKAYRQQSEHFSNEIRVTREVLADLSARVDRLNRRVAEATATVTISEAPMTVKNHELIAAYGAIDAD